MAAVFRNDPLFVLAFFHFLQFVHQGVDQCIALGIQAEKLPPPRLANLRSTPALILDNTGLPLMSRL